MEDVPFPSQFNNPSAEKDDHMSLSPEELAAEVFKPPAERSEKFRRYVAAKIAEQQQEISEFSPIAEQQRHYQKYLKDLALTEADLHGKRILDLGCGREAYFVKAVLDQNLTQDVYGLDIDVKPKKHAPKYRDHLIRDDFTDTLPLHDLDYIVSYASMSFGVFERPEETKAVLQNALNALRAGGQIRLYPIDEAPNHPELEGITQGYTNWHNLLRELAHEQEMTVEFQSVDIQVAHDQPDLTWLTKRLIITKP